MFLNILKHVVQNLEFAFFTIFYKIKNEIMMTIKSVFDTSAFLAIINGESGSEIAHCRSLQ